MRPSATASAPRRGEGPDGIGGDVRRRVGYPFRTGPVPGTGRVGSAHGRGAGSTAEAA